MTPIRALGWAGAAVLAFLFGCADGPTPDTSRPPPIGQGDVLPGTQVPPVEPVAPAIIHSPALEPLPAPSIRATAPTPVPVFSATPSAPPSLPQGPVTNYGTGGMEALPGSPPNPTYPPGGLMH